MFLLLSQLRVCKIVCNFQHYFGGRSKRESSCLEIRSSARFLREIWISYFARRILEGVFVGGIVNIRFTRFVCSALRFISHEPRKKDTHSLIKLNLLRFEIKILLFRLMNISLNTDNDRQGSVFHNIRVDVMFLILRWQEEGRSTGLTFNAIKINNHKLSIGIFYCSSGILCENRARNALFIYFFFTKSHFHFFISSEEAYSPFIAVYIWINFGEVVISAKSRPRVFFSDIRLHIVTLYFDCLYMLVFLCLIVCLFYFVCLLFFFCMSGWFGGGVTV